MFKAKTVMPLKWGEANLVTNGKERTMGLQKILHSRIKSFDGRIMPYMILEFTCRSVHQKNATGERRLRGAGNENIETVFNEKKHIIGWRWIKG